MRRTRQDPICELFAFYDSGHERLLQYGIGYRFQPVSEFLLIDKQLRLQDSQAIKFREQVGGGIGGGSERIFGMRLLPRVERLVGIFELEIVHLSVTHIERRLGSKDRLRTA